MNGVTTKITEKILVLFQHHNINTGPREQEAQHHARGSTPNDAALVVDRISVC